MIPILSVEEMRKREAPFVAQSPDSLVRAAGTAVAHVAQSMLGSCYARRVAVIAGPGLNGADGRVAGAWLKYRGARVDVINVADQPRELRGYDLVIDAAFGVGCSRPYWAPTVAPRTRVLAVDVPSGVNADSGELFGSPLRAHVTLAIGALKYCHLNGRAAEYAGDLRFVDIGVVADCDDGVLADGDLAAFVVLDRLDHKWKHAVQLYAGSPTMAGAAQLARAPMLRWPRIAAGAVCGVVVLCYLGAAFGTYERNRDWKDEESLWRDVTLKSPGNGRGLMNYGNTRMEKGNYASALDYFHRAQVLMPAYPVLLVNIAIAENATGHPAEAERHFQQALAEAPGVPDSYDFYARWLIEQQRDAEAAALLEKALAISPGDVTAREYLAGLRQGRADSDAVGSDRYLDLSLSLYQRGDYAGAISAAESALRLNPASAEAWNNMGAAYNSLGHYATASVVLEEALRLKPSLAIARNNLDYARRMMAAPPAAAR